MIKTTRLAFRHKQLADEKNHYRANLEAIFKSVQDGILTVDRDLRVVSFNEAAMQRCGYNHKEHTGVLLKNVT